MSQSGLKRTAGHRLKLKHELKKISHMGVDLVHIKGFALEIQTRSLRVFSDIDLYCPQNFRRTVKHFIQEGYEMRDCRLGLFYKQKIDLYHDDVHVEIHRFLLQPHSPYKLYSFLAKQHIVYSLQLNHKIFDKEFHLLYLLAHHYYGHIEGGNRRPDASLFIKLYKRCDKNKLLSLAYESHTDDLLAFFCERHSLPLPSRFCLKHLQRLNMLRKYYGNHTNVWWVYMLFAPLWLKPLAFLFLIFRAVFPFHQE